MLHSICTALQVLGPLAADKQHKARVPQGQRKAAGKKLPATNARSTGQEAEPGAPVLLSTCKPGAQLETTGKKPPSEQLQL